MNWFDAPAYVIVALGSLLLAILPFMRRYRGASLWLRLGFFLQAPIGLAWSGLGFYLLAHQQGERTLLSWPRFLALDHMKSNIAGLAVGMLLCFVFSPEFRTLARHNPSNQAMQPTAGHPDA